MVGGPSRLPTLRQSHLELFLAAVVPLADAPLPLLADKSSVVHPRLLLHPLLQYLPRQKGKEYTHICVCVYICMYKMMTAIS